LRSAATRPGKPLAEGDPDPLLDFLLEALRGGRNEFAGLLVQQEHRRRIRIQDLPHANQQLVQ
jgi:hypothetical protein